MNFAILTNQLSKIRDDLFKETLTYCHMGHAYFMLDIEYPLDEASLDFIYDEL
jgi:hypothetical protein